MHVPAGYSIEVDLLNQRENITSPTGVLFRLIEKGKNYMYMHDTYSGIGESDIRCLKIFP